MRQSTIKYYTSLFEKVYSRMRKDNDGAHKAYVGFDSLVGESGYTWATVERNIDKMVGLGLVIKSERGFCLAEREGWKLDGVIWIKDKAHED